MAVLIPVQPLLVRFSLVRMLLSVEVMHILQEIRWNAHSAAVTRDRMKHEEHRQKPDDDKDVTGAAPEQNP